jgi:hypothetical protein
MIDAIIELIKRAFEKDEKSRKFAVTLADSYLRRISRFQDQLVLLGVILNFSAVGYVLMSPADRGCGLPPLILASAVVLLTNLLLAKLYSNEHRTTKLLFARYPELELIMVGDKSWSNFRVLASAYKLVQAGWMLYSAVLAVFLAKSFMR